MEGEVMGDTGETPQKWLGVMEGRIREHAV